MGMGGMYGGMGGYGGRYGMGIGTGNQMMDQMNQYVIGISEMAGMVEHNAGGLAKFILLLKKMAQGVYTQGKAYGVSAYEKSIAILQQVR